MHPSCRTLRCKTALDIAEPGLSLHHSAHSLRVQTGGFHLNYDNENLRTARTNHKGEFELQIRVHIYGDFKPESSNPLSVKSLAFAIESHVFYDLTGVILIFSKPKVSSGL